MRARLFTAHTTPVPLLRYGLRGLLLLLVAAFVPFVDVLFATPQERKPRKVAFLVGIGKYDHKFSDLGKAPEKDVTALAVELTAGGFEVVTLLGSKPESDKQRATKANIEARFGELLAGKGKLRDGDTLVVALCGHGFQDNEPLFCPVDALPDRPATMVPLNKLIKDAEPFGATCLFLVDACREDPNRGRGGIQGKETKLTTKTAVLFSCKAGQLAYQDEKTGHGVFTFAVLKSMRDGEGTNWDRLVTGVKEAFQSDEIKAMLPPGKVQTPVHAAGELEFTALLAKKTAGDMAKKEPEAGDVREFKIADGVKMKFCWIPATKEAVQLGSPKAEQEYLTRMHHDGVRLPWLDGESERTRGKFQTKGFWLGKYEVTQQEWTAVMGLNPSWFNGKNNNDAKNSDTKRFPVESMGLDDCLKFLGKMNAQPGASTAFGKKGKFTLPHEDEWEYAARGEKGNQQAFYWGNELNGTQANCRGTIPYGPKAGATSLYRTCAVDDPTLNYPKHPWGLSHMHGNVWEICENKYGLLDANVARGGSWDFSADKCRAACRGFFMFASNCYGFRVAFRLD